MEIWNVADKFLRTLCPTASLYRQEMQDFQKGPRQYTASVYRQEMQDFQKGPPQYIL